MGWLCIPSGHPEGFLLLAPSPCPPWGCFLSWEHPEGAESWAGPPQHSTQLSTSPFLGTLLINFCSQFLDSALPRDSASPHPGPLQGHASPRMDTLLQGSRDGFTSPRIQDLLRCILQDSHPVISHPPAVIFLLRASQLLWERGFLYGE